MKGVILAGGSGTRLKPLSDVTCKQLLPVYDKPMIYYPLSTLLLAGVDQVLIITTPKDLLGFSSLLGNGSNFGIEIQYLAQDAPRGIAHGLLISETFVHTEPFWFILGDNLFHGPEFGRSLRDKEYKPGATIFSTVVDNPEDYGVVVSKGDKPINLVEKPKSFISSWAIPGLYRLDAQSIGYAKNLALSNRGEFEIIDVLKEYLNSDSLNVEKISRGNAWFDLGTFEQLHNGASFVKMIQERQGLLVGSPEESAYNLGRLTFEDYSRIVYQSSSGYYKALQKTAKEIAKFRSEDE